MKFCWLLTIFQSDAISAHGHTSLVSDKYVLAFRLQSVSQGQLVQWCGFHAARGES